MGSDLQLHLLACHTSKAGAWFVGSENWSQLCHIADAGRVQDFLLKMIFLLPELTRFWGGVGKERQLGSMPDLWILNLYPSRRPQYWVLDTKAIATIKVNSPVPECNLITKSIHFSSLDKKVGASNQNCKANYHFSWLKCIAPDHKLELDFGFNQLVSFRSEWL